MSTSDRYTVLSVNVYHSAAEKSWMAVGRTAGSFIHVKLNGAADQASADALAAVHFDVQPAVAA